jgi:transposase
MYRDPKQWAYVRRLVLEQGASRRGVSRKTGLSRKTVRKMLAHPRPPSNAATPLNGAEQKLLEAARYLAVERHFIDPTAYRRRALYLWGRTRDLILQLDRPRGAAFLRETAELINGTTPATELNSGSTSVGAGARLSRPGGTRARGGTVRKWLDCLLRGEIQIAGLRDLGSIEGLPLLLARINDGTLRQRKKAAAVVAHKRGVPIRTIAAFLSISRVSVRRYVRVFAVGGAEALFASRRRIGGRRAENEQVRKDVFGLLHEPPSASGITEPPGGWAT